MEEFSCHIKRRLCCVCNFLPQSKRNENSQKWFFAKESTKVNRRMRARGMLPQCNFVAPLASSSPSLLPNVIFMRIWWFYYSWTWDSSLFGSFDEILLNLLNGVKIVLWRQSQRLRNDLISPNRVLLTSKCKCMPDRLTSCWIWCKIKLINHENHAHFFSWTYRRGNVK